jgi:hypothetical protein
MTRKKANIKNRSLRTDGVINIIGLHPNITRVYEISKVGNHSIGFAYYSNPDDLGNNLDPKDIDKIIEFYSITPDAHPQLIVEVCKPRSEDIIHAMSGYFETLEAIHERVEKAKQFAKPSQLNESAKILLETAINRLNLGSVECENAIKVSATIAQMAFCNEIKAEHIAEAIQYCKKIVVDSKILIYKDKPTLEQQNAELLEALLGLNHLWSGREDWPEIKRAICAIKKATNN